MAGPGDRNYILRGLAKWGETVELPAEISGDPLTSFSIKDPAGGHSGPPCFSGVKTLILPRFLGRFPESNILFPDLENIAVDPANRIFTTDGHMLYKNNGRELFLSLAAGLKEDTVIIPRAVISLGEHSFENTNCKDIVFENPAVTACHNTFDNSLWLKDKGEAAYVGNMLYRVMSGTHYLRLKDGICRIHENAFDSVDIGTFTLCLPPAQPSFSIPSPISKIQNIEAYEGSCPNLMDAILTDDAGVFYKSLNTKAHPRTMHKSLTIKGKYRLFLPNKPSAAAKVYLEAAWNGPQFDFGQYDHIFCELASTEEK